MTTMRWFENHKPALAEVFAETERIVGSFPAPFADAGIHYLRKYNPLHNGGPQNYICYLLPFWLRDYAGTDEPLTREIAVANNFVMLAHLIDDDLMDGDVEQADWSRQMALSRLFHNVYEARYRQWFPSASVFWRHYEACLAEWAIAVASEQDPDYFTGDQIRLAHKASPLKLAAAAGLCLTGAAERIEEIAQMIDEALITLQMCDDWADWQDDLRTGNANALLALVRSEYADAGHPLTEETVRHAVLVRDAFSRYAAIADERHRRLEAKRDRSPELIEFHYSLASDIIREAERIENDKKLLYSGGFSYWLSKNVQ